MEAPKLPSFFKQNSSRSFNYQPIYYSEEKERSEEIRKRVAGEPVRAGKADFRSMMRAEMSQRRTGQSGSSNRRLLIIIASLLAIAYSIFKY